MAESDRRGYAVEGLAGAGLGLLVGILLGLSVANVVGSVIAALAAMLAVFLGLTNNGAPAAQDIYRSIRIASFGLACTAGVVCGVASRANDWLGSDIHTQVQQWTDAGASPSDAVAYVVYQRLGVVPSGRTIQPAPAPSDVVTALFSSHDVSECSVLSSDRFKSVPEQLQAMRNSKGVWEKFADSVSNVPPDKLSVAIDAEHRSICGF